MNDIQQQFLSSLLQCGTPITALPTPKFSCKKCDFYTNKISNYNEHLLTKKHKITSITVPAECPNLAPPAVPAPDPSNTEETYEPLMSRKTYNCKTCNKSYFSKKGVWQHSKKCQSTPAPIPKPESSDKTTIETIAANMMEMYKSNQAQMIQLITAVLTNVRTNMTPSSESTNANNNNTVNNVTVHGDMTNTTNNANNTFNMNFFLNEQCKDAMNMSDFIKAIELDSDDMDYVTTNGYVKGISNIFINNLEKTDISNRPIHCTDSKREVLYIKDDDKWERDSITSKKLIDAVRVVEHKNIVNVNEWAKQHPECENSVTRANDIYFKMSKSATDGIDENIAKVIKRVIQHVVIDKKELANQ
jgi:hypothetical protein